MHRICKNCETLNNADEQTATLASYLVPDAPIGASNDLRCPNESCKARWWRMDRPQGPQWLLRN
jgi:hypothetical protein